MRPIIIFTILTVLSTLSFAQTPIDPKLQKEIDSFFRIKADKFDTEKKTWYKPKGIGAIMNQRLVYCYFATVDGLPFNFRIYIQGTSWLNPDTYRFSIDDEPFEFIINGDVDRDYTQGKELEWSDNSVSSSDLPLIEALAKSKKAEIQIVGSKYVSSFRINQYQIDMISNCLYYYKKMGGTF
ncbi:MAG TPA: hypothetical protein VFG10_18900 [Saprospiraceae bacterium]|nr:hypothetical protein [Saprospiraceae bacterium]